MEGEVVLKTAGLLTFGSMFIWLGLDGWKHRRQERINLIEKDAKLGTVNIVLTVKDRIHLAHVIKRIRLIKGINKILRTKN